MLKGLYNHSVPMTLSLLDELQLKCTVLGHHIHLGIDMDAAM